MSVEFGKEKSIIVLVDPDKCTEKSLQKLVEFDHLPFCWLVGGSLLFESRFEQTVGFLKEFSKNPVVIFPGNNLQISENADALLFLSLLSGRNPEYLIGQHVIAAPKIKEIGLESIPTGYILIDGGRETAVSYISNTKPIPRDKPELAVATAMAAELLGKDVIYVEAGSGAQNHVPYATVAAIKNNVELPLIVGGGVRNAETVEKLFHAGADHVVIGNYIESHPEFLEELSKLEFFQRKSSSLQ